jgi:hypothetical protein
VVSGDGEELAVALVPCFSVGRGVSGVYGGGGWCDLGGNERGNDGGDIGRQGERRTPRTDVRNTREISDRSGATMN